MPKKLQLKDIVKMDIKDILRLRLDLSPKNQRLIGFGLLGIVALVSFVWVILPTNQKVVKLNRELKSQEVQIEALKVQIETMKLESERLDSLRKQLNTMVGIQDRPINFNLEDYTTLSIMKSIVQMAVVSGCTMEDFRPIQQSSTQQEGTSPSPPSATTTLKKKYVALNVRGKYPAIKRFIRRLVDFPALVSIEEASLEREVSEGNYEYVSANFQIVIYGINN